MSQELILELLAEKAENLQLKHTLHIAYKEFKLLVEKKYPTYYDKIDSIFPKPAIIPSLDIEYTENGDPIDQDEFTSILPNRINLLETNYGWLEEKILRSEIQNSFFYQEYIKRIGLGELPLDVKNNIEDHALHILGRCNNPKHWETSEDKKYNYPNWIVTDAEKDLENVEKFNLNITHPEELEISGSKKNDLYWKNKEGLVYGMVQSGKTASMISLVGLANSSGYNLFIILSGDKDSLRNQTQERFNTAFNLYPAGNPKKASLNFVSATENACDYNKSKSIIDCVLNFQKPSILLCIKKNTSTLKKLIKNLKTLQSQSESNNLPIDFNFKTDFNALILDDEADYASQDTKADPNSSSAIHGLIVELREQLPKNSFVSYTATPQACLLADVNKIVGYPSDFIWLIDPFRDEMGKTTSYMGLNEFFKEYEKHIINPLSLDAWPYHDKESKKVRIAGGDKLKINLNDASDEFINLMISEPAKRNDYGKDFKISLIDFFITCAIRWHRHYQKNINFFKSKLPTKSDIKNINSPGKKVTNLGFEQFPYHAMMFNLSYIKNHHTEIKKLIELLINDVKNEILTKSSILVEQYTNQLAKSTYFNKTTPTLDDLYHFILLALKINEDSLPNGDYLYILNSDDEGNTLDYTSYNKEERTKKAAIIIGGNILSRGLTVENLSTTVYIRSQKASLGDTNLQMCRWFGHKKNYIDLISAYMQEHSLHLFKQISDFDENLRNQFKEMIYKNTPAECILISLNNNPIFKATAPNKSRNKILNKNIGSYSGKIVGQLEPMAHPNYLDNYTKLTKFLKTIKLTNKNVLNRADIYEDVDKENFLEFFKNLSFEKDSLLITPENYISYLDEWHKDLKTIPKINIAIFGSKKDLKNRKRNDNNTFTARGFIGGATKKDNRNNKYLGDGFIDKPQQFQNDNINQVGLKRKFSDGILITFYILNHNYINKEKKIKKGHADYQIEPLVSFSVTTPVGGPQWVVTTNSTQLQRQLASQSECVKFENSQDEK